MEENLKSLQKLTECFKRLPGIGSKSAERMAYAILDEDNEFVKTFSDALLDVKNKIHRCNVCGLYTENDDVCDVCRDNTRNKQKIIVVSYPRDVIPFEKLKTLDATYHVLHGVISPIQGINIEDLNFVSLQKRIEENGVEEVILAMNPTIEGDITAIYIAKLLQPYNIKITRLAYGLPMGGTLEYADSLTLAKALEGRNKIEEE